MCREKVEVKVEEKKEPALNSPPIFFSREGIYNAVKMRRSAKRRKIVGNWQLTVGNKKKKG